MRNAYLVNWIFNKSLLTNASCMALIALGFMLPSAFENKLLNMGFFGLSGSLTNWLAIHMLFERVPGLYGSGIIPLKFEEFKQGIQSLIMNQFFNHDNIQRFVDEQVASHSGAHMPDLSPVLDQINYEILFKKLVETVEQSPLGPVLSMFGGNQALDALKPPFIEKTRQTISEMTKDESFQNGFKAILSKNLSGNELSQRIHHIVENRLRELTPDMVKTIIQDMIKSHLGWLVVWGGFFGALIGLVTSFMTA